MEELGAKIARICRLNLRRLVRRLSEESSRSYIQLRALEEIAEGGAHTQAALAERLQIDASATSRLVDRLEEEGLVKRCRGADRRCVGLAVTEAAQPELEALRRGLSWLGEEARRHLDDKEYALLEGLLDKLEQGLREGEPAAPCDKAR